MSSPKISDLSDKQDALTTGDHIDITSNTISVESTDSIDHVSATVSGDVISITDGGDGFPVEDLTVAIEPVQDTSSGDPSPDNVCPITGFTEANVTRCGVNVLNPDNVSSDGSPTPTISGGAVTLSAATGSSQQFRFNHDFLDTQTYTLSFYAQATVDGAVIYVDGYPDGGSGTFVADSAYSLSTTRTKYTKSGTIGSDTTSVRFFRASSTTGYDTADIVIDNIQLEFGSTATTYEEYQGTTYNLDWQSEAGTVYGGTLDVTTGLLTVTHKSVDMGDLSWVYTSNNYFITSSLKSVIQPATSGSVAGDIMCSCYKVVASSNVTTSNNRIALLTSGGIAVNDTDYTDATEFTTAVTGQTIGYELATALTYQLTATEITTLLGNNTLWADTGESTLTYNTDTDDILPTSEAVVDYVAPTKAVVDAIECTETTAGTYTLTATVDSDGNVTYSWS